MDIFLANHQSFNFIKMANVVKVLNYKIRNHQIINYA